MTVKNPKTTKHTHPKKTDEPVIPVVNVFDEEESAAPKAKSRRLVVEVEEDQPTAVPDTTTNHTDDLPTPTIASKKPSHRDDDDSLPTPVDSEIPEPLAPPVIANPAAEEPVLPSFFEQDLKGTAPKAQEPESPVEEPASAPAATQTEAPVETPAPTIETLMPQAIVGELNEIKDDVSEEKRGVWTLVFVMIGVLLIGGGVALFVLNRAGYLDLGPGMSAATPTPAPTIMPTPLPTIAPTPEPLATGSAQVASTAAKLKVNVLNGTKVAGLASKQAAVLKAAGYTTGTVGNGLPAEAGTIVVPKGEKALGEAIAAALKGFTFMITEDAAAKAVTVTLGQPEE